LGRNLRRETTFEYIRSDRSKWKLSLEEVMERMSAFEMAYNPNDCAEVRWGASKGSEEYRPCRHTRGAGQQKLMEKFRVWFQERRRPAW